MAAGSAIEMQATRRTQKHPEGEAWPGNYRYRRRAQRKASPLSPAVTAARIWSAVIASHRETSISSWRSSRLSAPSAGLHTSSYRSIRNLSNGLMQIRRLNGGSLGDQSDAEGQPERISYSDRDGTRHTSVAYILSLEIGGPDLRTLVANMTEPVQALERGPPGHRAVSWSPICGT